MHIVNNKTQFHSRLISNLIEEDLFIEISKVNNILSLPRKELLEDLHTILNNSITDFKIEWSDDSENIPHAHVLHALFLLHELKDESTFPVLMEFLKQDENFYEFYLSDYLTEMLWEHFLPFVESHMKEMEELLLDHTLYPFSRSAIATSISHAVLYYPFLRPEIINFFKRVLTHFINLKGRIKEEETQIVRLIVGDLISVNAYELTDLIGKIYSGGYEIDDMDGPWKRVKKLLESGELNHSKKTDKIEDRYKRIINLFHGNVYKDMEEEENENYNFMSDKNERTSASDLFTEKEIRSSQRDLAKIQQYLREQNFKSPEEMQAYINKNIVGKKASDIIPVKKRLTNREKAEELMDRASEQNNEVAEVLLNEALELDPTNVEVMSEIGRLNKSPLNSIEWFTRAIETFKKEFGEEFFKENKGNFWQIYETRPFILAKYYRAESFIELGKTKDAIFELNEIIELNPADNLGARDKLSVQLVKEDRFSEFRDLRKRYPDEDRLFSIPAYVYSIYLFKSAGVVQTFKDAIKKAVTINPHVVDYLNSKKQMPKFLPNTFSPGDENEAVICVDTIYELLKQNPEILNYFDKIKNRMYKK